MILEIESCFDFVPTTHAINDLYNLRSLSKGSIYHTLCLLDLAIGIKTERKEEGYSKNILVIPLVHLSMEIFQKQQKEISSKKATGDPHGPFRDTVRIHQLEANGWMVYSVSRMTSPDPDFFAEKHIEASLNQTDSDSRSFIKILKRKVNVSQKPYFSAIALDYLRMYSSYMRSCFKEYFWSGILPEMYKEGFICSRTPIYISNFETIKSQFEAAQKNVKLKGFLLTKRTCKPNDNPLFKATSEVSHELEKLSDPNTNDIYLKDRITHQKLRDHMFVIFLKPGTIT